MLFHLLRLPQTFLSYISWGPEPVPHHWHVWNCLFFGGMKGEGLDSKPISHSVDLPLDVCNALDTYVETFPTNAKLDGPLSNPV